MRCRIDSVSPRALRSSRLILSHNHVQCSHCCANLLAGHPRRILAAESQILADLANPTGIASICADKIKVCCSFGFVPLPVSVLQAVVNRYQ